MSSPDGSSESPPPTPIRGAAPDAHSPEIEGGRGGEEGEPGILADGRWVARVGGSTRSGTGSDSGVPLVLLLFHRRDPDSGVVDSRPEREAWAVQRDLYGWRPDRLEEMLARSRPFRPLPPPPAPTSPGRPTPGGRRTSAPRPRRLD